MSKNGWTSHGHRIEGVPQTGERPKQVARCGGPGLCGQCSVEQVVAQKQHKKSEEDPLETKHAVERAILECLSVSLQAAGANETKVYTLEVPGQPQMSFMRSYMWVDGVWTQFDLTVERYARSDR